VNEPLPGLLQDVFGAVVKEYHSPQADEVNAILGIGEGIGGETSQVTTWLDIMQPKGAQVIAEYEAGFGHGEPAITLNSFGRGRACYIGTQPGQEFVDALMESLATGAGVEFGPDTPEGVDASIREGKSGKLVFIANHTEAPVMIDRPEGFTTDVIRQSPAPDLIQLESYDVAVLSM